jgi:hypothetical protein
MRVVSRRLRTSAATTRRRNSEAARIPESNASMMRGRVWRKRNAALTLRTNSGSIPWMRTRAWRWSTWPASISAAGGDEAGAGLVRDGAAAVGL